MTSFRTLGAVALLALAGAGTSSCLKAPDFPVTPSISFNSLKSTFTPRVAGAQASQLA